MVTYDQDTCGAESVSRHPAQEKRATPLQLDQLEQVVQWLDAAIHAASTEHN